MKFKLASIPIAILLLMLACSSIGMASTGPGDKVDRKQQNNSANRVVETWVERMKKIEQMVQKGGGRKALRTADDLAAEIVDRIQSGDASQLLGTLSVLRAIAAYNAGDERLALWHWHIGLQMFPTIGEYRLDMYGEAGRFLEEHPFLETAPSHTSNEDNQEQTPGQTMGKITPPRKKKGPKPKFPPGKRHTLKEPVTLVVQTIIDKQGRVTQPVILKAEGEFTLVCASLEALWQWEFEPAKIDGEPVDVYYNLSVNFKRPAP